MDNIDQTDGEQADGALAGLRILEVGSHVSAPFAGKLLADYGADVIKIEPPDGDSSRRHGPFPDHQAHPERSALFLALNTNKRSVTLDLESSQGQHTFRQLAATADAIVENLPSGTLARWGLDWPSLAAVNPALVMTSVTTFGQTGPYAGYLGPNLVSCAVGGQMHMTGDTDREPLKNGGYLADGQAGLNAFAATAVVALGARMHGRGEHVDVGAMQCQASVLEASLATYCYTGKDTSMRRGNLLASFLGMYPCVDGQIGIHAMPSNWIPLLQTLGMEALSEDPRFKTQADRGKHNAELVEIFSAWAASQKKKAVYARAGELRGPIAYVHDMQDLLDSPQLTARGFLRSIDHPQTGPLTYMGPPFEMSETPARDGRAPQLGEHNDEVLAELRSARPVPRSQASAVRKSLPLEGVRILDLTMVWAGPYATRILGDMGAEIIKIESLQVFDLLRALGGSPPGTERPWNKSAYFNHNNRNKLSATLNLRDPAGKALLLGLVEHCDVVIENYSATVMDRLGLDYATLKSVKPDIIMVSMPGHGKTGPERDRVAYGTNVEQLAGIVSVSGYEGGEPQKSGISFGDPMAGTAAVGAVASALHYRERTGKGQCVDLAQREALSGFIGEYMVAYSMNHELPRLMGNKHPFHAPHGVYPCAPGYDEDDAFVAIAVETNDQFRTLSGLIGQPALADDPRFSTAVERHRNQDQLTEAIAAWTGQQDKLAAMDRLQAAGVPAGAVLSVGDLATSPHLRARGFFEQVVDPEAGTREMEGPAWILSTNPAHIQRPAPNLGEHNEYVLQELLGVSDAELAELEARGIVGTVPEMERHT